MADSEVSVVIPLYNHSKFITQAIESVVNQTYRNLELIVVDDGSTDGSADIITELAVKYKSRFKEIILSINEKNEGAHSAINKGVAACRSNYISLLNSDDMYQPNRISSLVEKLTANDGDIAFSAISCIDAAGNKIDDARAEQFENIQKRLIDVPFTALACLAENIAVSTGNLLFTKSLFNKLSGFRSYKYIHDYDFFFRSSLITEPIYDADTQYLYRIHDDNTFSKIHKTGVAENRILWLAMYNQIKAGEISNPYILDYKNYRSLFEDQISKEGSKKQFLWKIADNPLIKFGLPVIKKFRGIK